MARKKRVPEAASAGSDLTKKPWNDTRGQTAAEKKAEKKTPVEASLPIPIDDKYFTWTAELVDHQYSADWDWDLAPKETADLLQLLADSAALRWGELKQLVFNSKNTTRALHHSQPVDSICKAARDRLDEIGRGDQESLFRLRHGNTVRVWGILEGPVFRILWYDREHKVYPQET